MTEETSPEGKYRAVVAKYNLKKILSLRAEYPDDMVQEFSLLEYKSLELREKA